MANKYTQLTRTPYIPQYSPPNFGALQQAGQNLYQRQQQGAQRYDALQESLNQLDVMQEDKEILERKRNEIQSQLSQFAETNDFIDAQPALRKQARNLSRSLQEGELAIALENKASALQTFKAIEESDWTPQQKEKMKEMFLRDYEGADKTGRLGVMNIPDYIDTDKLADEAAKSVDKTSHDVLTMATDPRTKMPIRVKRSVESRGAENVENAVINDLKGNDKVVSALAMQARMNGFETQEEIRKYVNKEINNLARSKVGKYGRASTSISNIQWGDLEGGDSSNRYKRLEDSKNLTTSGGPLMMGTVVDDFKWQLEKLSNVDPSNKDKYETVKQGVMMAALPALEAGPENGGISQEDFDFFMNNLQHIKSKNTQLIPTHNVTGWSAYFGNDVLTDDKKTNIPYKQTEKEKQKTERFTNIMNKLHNFNKERGGTVGIGFGFKDKEMREDARVALQNHPPMTYDLVNSKFQNLSEKEKNKKIVNILNDNKYTFQGLNKIDENIVPTYRFQNNETGEIIIMREKMPEYIKGGGHHTPMREIFEIIGTDDPAVRRLADNYSLAKIPVSGNDVYDQLPQQSKQLINNVQFEIKNRDGEVIDKKPTNIVRFNPKQGGGVEVEYGARWEDDAGNIQSKQKPLTNYEVLNTYVDNYTAGARHGTQDAREYAAQYANRIKNMIYSANLTIPEKELAYNRIIRNKGIPESIDKQLKISLGDSHIFEDKIQAHNFLARQ